MSAQHTPAPWWSTNHGIRDRGGYIAHTNNVQRYEGQDERYVREVAQRKADKLLIAAAPDLLAALERLSFAALCRDSTTGDQCRLIEVKAELAAANEQACAAIAKAKGNPS